MPVYLYCGREIAESFAFAQFKGYQRSLGTPDAAIPSIWESCHTHVETRIRELPVNLEIVIE